MSGTEIVVILLLALVVLGPEKLPDAIRKFGKTYAELKKMGTGFQQEFKSAIDEPMREMRETADLLKKSADFSTSSAAPPNTKPKNDGGPTPVTDTVTDRPTRNDGVAPADPDAEPTADVPFADDDTAPDDDTPTDDGPFAGDDTAPDDDNPTVDGPSADDTHRRRATDDVSHRRRGDRSAHTTNQLIAVRPTTHDSPVAARVGTTRGQDTRRRDDAHGAPRRTARPHHPVLRWRSWSARS